MNLKTDEEKMEISKKISESLKGKHTGKKIVQIDKTTNEVIKVWEYANQCALKLDIDASSIIKCCKGKIKSYKGFKWRYYEE